MTIVIDPEFKALIPPMSAEERDQLEKNLIADGCRDPLVVWNGILIDGHNRYEICTRLDIPFETVQATGIASRDDAEEWIIRNQFGRRNLIPFIRTQLALKLEGIFAKRAKENLSAVGGDRKSPCQISDNPIIDPIDTKREIARIAGVSHDTVAKVKKIEERATPEIKVALAKGEISINQAHTQIKRELKEEQREARREENRQIIAQAPSPIVAAKVARFATIVIDPPWDWGDEGDQDQLGRARPDYSTMSLSQLMDLPIRDLADDDCHIYLWITNRSLPKGFQLLDQWGFRYVTALTWVKPHFGMGNYFRGQTEHVLFGVKGSQMLKRRDVGTMFNAPRGPNGHSSKPVEFYDLVESCSPGPYMEMFSRYQRVDWTTWGESSAD